MNVSLDSAVAERLNKLVHHNGQSPGDIIAQALNLLEDYQSWEEEQDRLEIEAVHQEIEQEGTIPWATVKADLGR
ncbi:MAG: elongation factor 1 delta (guanine nucleotide exchange protein) [Cyanobacteria bacterium P01_G01_bin.54]